MNKVWLIAGLVLSLPVVLAACGGGATPAPTPTATPVPVATPAPISPSAGKELFTSLGCLACHKINGEGGAVGPPMIGLYGSQRELEGGGTVSADHDYIEESIKDSRAKVVKGFPPEVMPSFSHLSHDQIDQLIEFIESLK